jgi:nucleotide-binding universal stress UspA family protein
VSLWLWFTVVFANFAETIAEGRGKAQANTLRKMRREVTARRLRSGKEEQVPSSALRKGDLVVVEAGQLIPGDGEIIEGVASVNESAITGESAPVIRESGGDRSAVTGGTTVLSDRIVVRITADPGESFLDRMMRSWRGRRGRRRRTRSRSTSCWALEHFFRDANLATLRELSLREVAESLDRTAIQAARLGERQTVTRGPVMVCLSSNPPRALALLRRGARMAGRLDTDWYVVYVETPQETPERIDAEAQRHLLGNIDRARELGAEVVRLHSDDPATALLDFARSHRVSDLIIGRTEQPRWRRLLGRSWRRRRPSTASPIPCSSWIPPAPS